MSIIKESAFEKIDKNLNKKYFAYQLKNIFTIKNNMQEVPQ